MRFSKYLWPMVFATALAGCSFSGGNAPITDGPTSSMVYTVKPGDTLYAISSRYGLDPAAVARENNLANPSQISVGQKLRLSVSGSTAANIQRVSANTAQSQSSTPASKPAAAAASTSQSASSSSASQTDNSKSSDSSSVKTSGIYSWPSTGKIIENFGGMNKGIDIAGNEGEAVKAAADGSVLFVGNVQGYGNVAMVRDKAGYVAVYGRVKSVNVKQGDTVKKGQKIATMGKTDKSARVHFEIRINGKPVDPLTMLQKR